MRMDKWKVAFPIFVCATLCLYAAQNPDNTDTNVPPSVLNTDDNVPPGVRETDWHTIRDDFGFEFRVTKEPPARAEVKFKRRIPASDDATGEEKIESQRELRWGLLAPGDAMGEEKIKIRRKPTMRLEELLVENQSSVRYGVGRAQAVFYARKANKWYMVTTPPPPVGLHLLMR